MADYVVEAKVNGHWEELVTAYDNYLRLVRHKIEPVATSAIKIRVLRTQGDALASVFEERCYA